MVSKVKERGVSISLFWRDVVRNIDCSNAFFVIFGPLFCPVLMFWLACVKFLIILEAVKNRRVYAFFIEFSDKFFGLERMLLPRMSTMLCTTRFLECHVGVCDAWLEFFVVCRKAFL